MYLHVSVQIELEDEGLGAELADMGPPTGMNHEMLCEVAFLEESFTAVRTNMSSLASVPHPVLLQQLTSSKLLPALSTGMSRLTRVDPSMSRQFSLHREYPTTILTLVLRLIPMCMGVVNVEEGARGEEFGAESTRKVWSRGFGSLRFVFIVHLNHESLLFLHHSHVVQWE